MNYIYDIFVNFNEEFYDFYDWNSTDKIIHIRRIPIFRVTDIVLKEVKNNFVKFDDSFLDLIKNKTECFSNKNIKVFKYAFLLTDGLEVIGINIGKTTEYTSLQITEELDILDELRIKEYDLTYQILNKKNNEELKTRNQIMMEKKMKDSLKSLKRENNISKIKYIYYECFNKKENDETVIFDKLAKSIENREIFLKLNDFFDLNKQIN